MATSSSAAREMLEPIYSRFAEGFETKDLTSARHLLGKLGGVPRTSTK
jgi:hypothetical protein